MKTSLIITTYNSPRFLELSILSAFRQQTLPDEIIIADDGSGEQTRMLVEEMGKFSPVELKHVWQPDEGFRLGAIRNKAIAVASGEYVIQVDGDIIMHPCFVKDHIRAAEEGYFITGSRVLLNRQLTDKLTNEKRITIPYGKLGFNRIFKSLRIPALVSFFYNYKSGNRIYVRGCNMSFWKADLLSVNGYNEDITGWGREDSEIACRLVNSGIKKRFIKFGAIEYHLFHRENDKSSDKRNISLMDKTISLGIKRIPNGITKD